MRILSKRPRKGSKVLVTGTAESNRVWKKPVAGVVIDHIFNVEVVVRLCDGREVCCHYNQFTLVTAAAGRQI